ncbi:hypothetical protein COCC4DRAFT_56629 [Bipolaris maydis ATCC 48331]|uniref:Uncharacterized protein n=2 Tax=Cochliobolus heterostrophus TaxID=5016 RepID=M2TVW7_COCH5|nr:uncharacterized protein COCC4DRAFT_56629 [Bipolaris maydis ATCC 48331]EMD90679.1 hypothetical protein COCHEDRAFT_1215635 [Bipolaris maydis C5]ENI09109.1 hypothetical protein COCC4DRAFT_56629 [Bipolaris maydis ATCC 48331]KAH7555601.1 hypothetical protein BM1_07224 [Bipolaris maydis]KAJ6195784.1 hypothetical protein J3E72DRAFT_270879 [Bipolaris maydis]
MSAETASVEPQVASSSPRRLARTQAGLSSPKDQGGWHFIRVNFHTWQVFDTATQSPRVPDERSFADTSGRAEELQNSATPFHNYNTNRGRLPHGAHETAVIQDYQGFKQPHNFGRIPTIIATSLS